MVKIEDRYKKLSPIEHVLQRPETYIGSTTTESRKIFISDNDKIILKELDYNPGFLKIVDEILVNCTDHYIRTNGAVKYIKITINNDHIIAENDGPGIPVVIHKDEKMYVPEMLFGNMLTSENYDDTEERIVGGRNGIGAKSTNIYSKKFIIETADGKKQYIQEFSNNLSITSKPKIKKYTKNYTKITFYPDLERFGLTSITDEIKQILNKRVMEMAIYCPNVKVYFNDNLIKIKSYKDYIKMFTDSDEIFCEKLNGDWEIGVIRSLTDDFQQISMVNGIQTIQGGTHVNYIINQIIKEITEQLQKKNKNIKIKPNDIKSKLFLFLSAKVVNPVFDSQTKETLTTRLTKNHIENITVSDKFIKQLINSSIIEDILNEVENRENAELKKLNKGKTTKVRIKKLDDANMAGTSQSQKATLFLAEGDSGNGTVITGFSSTGRDFFGAFPLKGKPLNVLDIPMQKIKDNDEIKNLITALGLEFGKKYTSTKDLRYGRVVFATDSDPDGYHIRGLLLNLFNTFWKELLFMDFLYEFVTPIVKVFKGKDVTYFYKLHDYNMWKKKGLKGYEIVYYKGLGTITADESKMFFKSIEKHLIKYNFSSIEETAKMIDLCFNKKKADERKNWLLQYVPNKIIDKFNSKTTYESFFNDEFIDFSMEDNIRSIPSLIDGFKPSQRKVMFTMLENNYKTQVKVANLSGAITDKTSYHHGPQSLEGTIVNMAQDFVGTNNINLLQPLGNYGSRLKGGKDAASSRYIFTRLSDISKNIFNENDEPLLTYLDDDGFSIEPMYYVPIIPMVLVNGSSGIGTGWSTDIPNYNPNDIIKYLVNKIKNQKVPQLHPYYKNFCGEIIYDSEKNRYITKGVIHKVNMSSLKITELPIGMWNDKYYDILDDLIDLKVIKDYKKNDTDTKVDIIISIDREILKELEDKNSLISTFKLETYISMNNMHLFNKDSKIQKYDSVDQIINDFYDVRLDFYQKRKDYKLQKLENERIMLFNKMKFINEILKGNLVIQNKKRTEIEEKIEALKIVKIEDSFNYLLNMSLLSLSNEKLLELKKIYNDKKIEIETLTKTDIKDIWLSDLNDLFKKLKVK